MSNRLGSDVMLKRVSEKLAGLKVEVESIEDELTLYCQFRLEEIKEWFKQMQEGREQLLLFGNMLEELVALMVEKGQFSEEQKIEFLEKIKTFREGLDYEPIKK